MFTTPSEDFELVGLRSTGEYDDVWFAGSFDIPNDDPASFVSYSNQRDSNSDDKRNTEPTQEPAVHERGDEVEESVSHPAAETHGARPQTAGETPGGSLERRRHRALHCTPCLLAP